MHIKLLRSCLNQNAYNVIPISETWITEAISDNTDVLDGYTFVRRDRDSKRGGDVAVYVMIGLNIKSLETSNGVFIEPEFIIMEICCQAMSPLLLSIDYRLWVISILT